MPMAEVPNSAIVRVLVRPEEALMNKRLLLALGMAFLCGGGAVFLACGGDDNASSGGGEDGGADGTLNQGDSGGGNDSGTGGGDDSSTGQTVSNPGQVSCGNAACGVPEEFCCIHPDGGGETCVDAGGPRVPGACTDGIEIYCDEAADCVDSGVRANPEVCCVRLLTNIANLCSAGRACETNGGKPACKDDAECGDAGKCVTQTCRGRVFSTCGGFPVNDAGVVRECR